MFTRVTNDSIRHGYRNARGFLTDSYSKTLCLGSALDQAVRDGKAIYAVVEPFIRAFANTGRANRALTDGLTQYESLRDKAMDINQRVQGTSPQLRNLGY